MSLCFIVFCISVSLTVFSVKESMCGGLVGFFLLKTLVKHLEVVKEKY